MTKKILSILFIVLGVLFILNGCNKKPFSGTDAGLTAEEKRRKNINEGRGISLKGIVGSRGNTNYEFSTSNPMWRASLETLDFLPLTTVDYSGGVIITDWYSDGSNTDQVKITVRFLSNEINSSSLKIIVHKKNCTENNNCKTIISENNLIENELRSTILRKAALFEKADKEKK